MFTTSKNFNNLKFKKSICSNNFVNSCYFRTTVKHPYKKALLQITEKCNLKCSHCFLSAEHDGNSISFEDIKNKIIPNFKKLNVISVTLTGGEPMVHKDIYNIVKEFINNDIKVTICTNGTVITEKQIVNYYNIGNVLFNVSLDGFSCESYGKFRGNPNSFLLTKKTIEVLGKFNLLKGLLVTPNNFAKIEEYEDICKFAINNKANYVLMNPLSNMGRGNKSKNTLGGSDTFMNNVRSITNKYRDKIDVTYIRFPNINKELLCNCEAGNIFYIFSDGRTTICPYLVFASWNKNSKHNESEFIVGNILTNNDIVNKFNEFNFNLITNIKHKECSSCSKRNLCGKGCPASIMMDDNSINNFTDNLCPLNNK